MCRLNHIWCLLFLLSNSVYLQAQSLSAEPVQLSGKEQVISLDDHILFVKDENRATTPLKAFAELKQKGVTRSKTGSKIIFEQGDHNFWGYFEVHNAGKQTAHFLFQLENYYLDSILLYEIDEGKPHLIGISGDHYPFASRSIHHRGHLFELNFPPKQNRAFLFMFNRKGSNVVSFKLKNAGNFIGKDSDATLLLGMYVGMIVLLLFFALGTFIFLRKKLYLFYGLYILACGLSLGNVYGLSFRYLYANMQHYTDYINPLTAFLSVIFFFLFTAEFLKLKETRPKWYTFIHVYILFYIGVAVTCTVLYSLKVKFPVLGIHYTLLVCSILLLLFSAALSFKHERRSALYFIISFTPITWGTLVQISLESGTMESSTFSEYTLLLASALEILIISVGIALQLKQDYTKRLELSAQVAQHEKQLLLKLAEGEDREKRRVAFVLHDTVGVKLRLLKHLTLKGQQKDAAEEIDLLASEIRDLSHAMAPTILDFVSLPEAIKDLCNKFDEATCSFQVFDFDFPDLLDKKLNVLIYSILQELINNILKHANAQHATVQFMQDEDGISITVEDDGVGFDVHALQTKGLGLAHMQARVSSAKGTFHLESQPNKGTLCILSFPHS